MAITIAVAGNPNSGKTTLFNALTGMNQYVGNWPGVTVEKKEGQLKGYPDVRLVDLPGIYSLSANSLEEEIARDYLLTSNPDVIINIVDGTNLERNLYLTNQLAELDIPIVLAINMMDEVQKSGRKIDSKALGAQFGIPVVEISALRETQIDKLAKVAMDSAQQKQTAQILTSFSCGTEKALSDIEKIALDDRVKSKKRWYAINLFVRNDLVKNDLNLTDDQSAQIEDVIQKCELEFEDESYSIVA